MKQRQIGEHKGGGTFHADVSRLIDQVIADDRLRLLDPTSVPKVLRGRRRRVQPNTSIISEAAFAVFRARLKSEGRQVSDLEAAIMFAGRS